MNVKIPLVIGVAVCIVMVFAYAQNPDTDESGLKLSYEDINQQTRDELDLVGISMSSPIRLGNSELIQTYCDFLADKIEYCTSTELLDGNGDFLGNIHVLGDTNPKTAMAVVQLDALLSQKTDAKSVFSALTKVIICDCWSMGRQSMDAWAESYVESHINSESQSTASDTITIEDRSIQMKLLTNPDGYEWQMLIT